MRKPIIAGNWKMNNTVADTEKLLKELIPMVEDAVSVDVVVCVPFTDIAAAARIADGTNVRIGAQNVSWADKGAFTGEISADMLTEAGAEYVIIGHSERRQYFGETDGSVNMRAKKAIEKGLKPIVCVGETLAERESGQTEAVLAVQLEGGFKDITAGQMASVVVAYEPVWAIGTGRTATSGQAQDTIRFIRNKLSEMFGRACADEVRIQYGGSMNPSNASELMAQPDIDGGLIGGASLKAADFTQVVKF